MKIRKIKQNLWARRFVSNGHFPDIEPKTEKEWRDAVNSKFVAAIHGLSYDDARSQQRRRRVPHGRRALRFLPIDAGHCDHRERKKISRETQMSNRRQMRQWRQYKQDLKAMTPTAKRFYEANKPMLKSALARQKRGRRADKANNFVPFGKRVRPEFE